MKELRPELHTTNEPVLITFTGKLLEHYIIEELKARNFKIKVLVRNQKKIQKFNIHQSEIIEAVSTLPNTIKGEFKNIKTIIATTEVSVDEKGVFDSIVHCQGNTNLLLEAKNAGVKKFILIATLPTVMIQNTKILVAHNKFIRLLKDSGIKYTVIHVNKSVSTISNKLDNHNHYRKFICKKKNHQGDIIHPRNLAITSIEAIKSNYSEITLGRKKCSYNGSVFQENNVFLSKSLLRNTLLKDLNEFIGNLITRIKPTSNY